jgi:hypothetical protein
VGLEDVPVMAEGEGRIHTAMAQQVESAAEMTLPTHMCEKSELHDELSTR